MLKPKLIPCGYLVLGLTASLLITAMSCTRIAAPLEPISLTPLPITATATPQPTATPAATSTPTPSINPSPTPETGFQNFEPANGTPGLYFQDFGSASSLFTDQSFTGSRALQTTISPVAAGWVRVYPASASVNLTGNGLFWVYVFDNIGEQFFNLTLTDASGASQTMGSMSMSNPGNWSMIYWTLGSFTGVNLATIVHCEIRPGIAATFRFDSVSFGNF
jgi:hypothetical protein